MKQSAVMVQTSGPCSSQVLAKASLAGSVTPSVGGLNMGQGLSSTNQIAVGAQIMPTHQDVVKEDVKMVGPVADQASELIPVAMLPGSMAEVQMPNEGKFQE